MASTKPERRARARDVPPHVASGSRRAARVIRFAWTSATTLIRHVPGTIRSTRAGAAGTASALQTYPDRTLRWLAATSLGLGAGFYLSGAPRLIVAAGVAPALAMGAAIALRPAQPVLPAEVKS